MATEALFTVRQVDDIKVISFAQGQMLSAASIDQASAGLKDLVDQSDAKQFVVDFSRISYLSSSALGMLISLQKRILQAGGDLKLCGIGPDIMEVFTITKLDTVFDIYKDIPAAVEACRGNR
jgi:anti-sigma B factor antagonist